MTTQHRTRTLPTVIGFGAIVHATLIWLGRNCGSTSHERLRALPGDDIVPNPKGVTDHAVTIDAPAE